MLKKKDDAKLIKRIIRINHPLNVNRTNREWNIFSISQHYKFKKKKHEECFSVFTMQLLSNKKKKEKKDKRLAKAYILNNYCVHFNYLKNSNKLIYALILLYATLITEACNHMKDCSRIIFFVAITKKL